MLYINHATLLTSGRQIDDGAVLVDGRRIEACGPAADIPRPSAAQTIDADGLLLAPGFIDLQINGAFGHDFTADPDSIGHVAAKLPRYGVTAFLPTVITSPLQTVSAAQDVLAGLGGADTTGARPLGLHVEGPFLNPDKRGAHNPDHLLLPDLAAARGWSPERGVRLVTLAPELPRALDLVTQLVARGVVVSAGHSTATYEQAKQGFGAGIRYGTHLFNGMPTLHHREPGLVGALLSNTGIRVGLIVDGIHIHPSVVDLVWRAVGPARLTLVTDAIGALGMPPGRHQLADFEVDVDETSVRLPDGTLAGSILSLDVALRNLMVFTGCSLAQALPTVTATPAELLGLGAERGHIAPGAMADLVLLTPDLQVQTTIAEGTLVYQRAEAD